jgi:hypothetical protein
MVPSGQQQGHAGSVQQPGQQSSAGQQHGSAAVQAVVAAADMPRSDCADIVPAIRTAPIEPMDVEAGIEAVADMADMVGVADMADMVAAWAWASPAKPAVAVSVAPAMMPARASGRSRMWLLPSVSCSAPWRVPQKSR